MRMRPLQSLLFAALLFLIVLPQVACTAIGALLGSAIDSPSTPRVIPTGEAVTVPRGKRLIVTTRDGRRFVGVYRDTASLADSEHDALWRRWLADLNHAAIAVPGDEVTVTDANGEWRGVFAGYHYRCIEVAPLRGEPRRIPMAALIALRGPGGQQWTGEVLEALDASGALPSRMAIVLTTNEPSHGITRMESGERAIALSEIYLLTLDHSHAARNVGVVVGLAADMLVVAAVASASSSWGWTNCSDLDLGGWGGTTELLREVQLTQQPYDRYAGAFTSPTAGQITAGRHAASVRP